MDESLAPFSVWARGECYAERERHKHLVARVMRESPAPYAMSKHNTRYVPRETIAEVERLLTLPEELSVKQVAARAGVCTNVVYSVLNGTHLYATLRATGD